MMNQDGYFLLTFVPPKGILKSEYKGSKWLGRSHKSDKQGMAYYKKETIIRLAEEHGFVESKNISNKILTANQEWLVLQKT